MDTHAFPGWPTPKERLVRRVRTGLKGRRIRDRSQGYREVGVYLKEAQDKETSFWYVLYISRDTGEICKMPHGNCELIQEES